MRGQTMSFPDRYAGLDSAPLLDAFRQGPERVRAVLKGLSDDALRAHPIPDKWSALEIAMHVVDSELVGAVRIRLILGGDEPPLPGYDQDRWTRDFAHGKANAARLEGALALFTALRAATDALFAGASPADWSRTGAHPEYGPVTLRNLLELYADHSERHIAQILERRQALGVPLSLPPLLPERL